MPQWRVRLVEQVEIIAVVEADDAGEACSKLGDAVRAARSDVLLLHPVATTGVMVDNNISATRLGICEAEARRIK